MYGDTRPIHTQALNAAKDKLEQILELQADLEYLPVEVGRVLVSSGQLISSEFTRLNWAFVGQKKSHPLLVQAGDLPNRLPTTEDFVFSRQSLARYGKSEEYVPDNHPFSPKEFSRMVKDDWFFKVGQTTNITAGICSGVHVDVPLKDWDIFYDENGNRIVGLDDATIRHWVVMNRIRDSKTNETRDATFSEKGDSGSFVVDRFGEVAGLLYGQYSNFSRGNGGMGLVTCISEVVPSIERRTTLKNEIGEDIKGELTLPTIWSLSHAEMLKGR
jgi:hypothetical protein